MQNPPLNKTENPDLNWFKLWFKVNELYNTRRVYQSCFPCSCFAFISCSGIICRQRKIIKKIRMHGRRRFGIQEKKFCHYFLVLKEGTGKEKNIKRRLKHMNELEEIQRHGEINQTEFCYIISGHLRKCPEWCKLTKSGKVWCSSPGKKKERGGRRKKKRKGHGEPPCLLSQQKTRNWLSHF